MKIKHQCNPWARRFSALLVTAILSTLPVAILQAQVIVDNKNINDDDKIEYIQFMYYVDKSNFKPIYFIDYGTVESDTPAGTHQRIIVDGVEITYNMTPMMALNRLYKGGWEYLGDAIYISMPMRDNWLVFTLKRKRA